MPAPCIRHLGGANNARKEQTKVYVRALGGAKKGFFLIIFVYRRVIVLDCS